MDVCLIFLYEGGGGRASSIEGLPRSTANGVLAAGSQDDHPSV